MKAGQVVILLVLALTSFASCQQGGKDENVSDSLKNVQEEFHEPKKVTTKNDIQGVWALPDSENATFSIRGDSIHYTDSDKSYSFELVSNTMKIFYEDWNYVGQVRYIPEDTLILESEGEQSIFTRFKK